MPAGIYACEFTVDGANGSQFASDSVNVTVK